LRHWDVIRIERFTGKPHDRELDRVRQELERLGPVADVRRPEAG
jgi:hypothetical protein